MVMNIIKYQALLFFRVGIMNELQIVWLRNEQGINNCRLTASISVLVKIVLPRMNLNGIRKTMIRG